MQGFGIPNSSSIDCRGKEVEGKFGASNAKYDEKGVIKSVLCCHGTPLLFLDTFVGERYGYNDFLLLEYLEKRSHIKNVIFFYDVNCRYRPQFVNTYVGMFY